MTATDTGFPDLPEGMYWEVETRAPLGDPYKKSNYLTVYKSPPPFDDSWSDWIEYSLTPPHPEGTSSSVSNGTVQVQVRSERLPVANPPWWDKNRTYVKKEYRKRTLKSKHLPETVALAKLPSVFTAIDLQKESVDLARQAFAYKSMKSLFGKYPPKSLVSE